VEAIQVTSQSIRMNVATTDAINISEVLAG
jgi:hypothetical protein